MSKCSLSNREVTVQKVNSYILLANDSELKTRIFLLNKDYFGFSDNRIFKARTKDLSFY